MEDIKEILKNINLKIEELKKAMNENKLHCEKKEENILKKLEILSSKVEALTKSVNEQYCAKDNLVTYIIGAFVGGLIMGLSFYKRTKG